MKPVFVLRIDIDSIKGLRQGVPPILDVLKENELKASFFCPMGWEGDLLTVIKHRFVRAKKYTLKKGAAKRLGYTELLRALFFPRKFLYERKILERILNEGHDLGVHGFIHARWRKPSATELEDEFKKMTNAYENAFGKKPEEFASPLFACSERILQLTDSFGYKYGSCMKADMPFKPKGYEHVQVPVTIDVFKGEDVFPSLYWNYLNGITGGKSVDQVFEKIKIKISSGKFACMYIHPKDEGIYLLKEFSELMKRVSLLKCEINKFSEIAR